MTTILYCEWHKLLICGSKDCRISIWKVKDEYKLENKYVLYGHDYEICAMSLSYDLSILISVDKND